MSVTVTLIGKDKLSGPFGKGTRGVVGMGKAIGGLGLKFAKFGAIAGIAIGGIGIKLAADLGEGLREVGTLMGGLTDNQMKAMTKELESLAASSGQAIDKLVKAKYDIISAGFVDAAESAEILRAATDLAIGGVADVALTADLLTTTINAYGDAALSAAETSNKLFTIVRLGKTTISELGGSMGRLLSIAGQIGIDIDEVGAALATLTASGQGTREAVTAVRGAMVQMIKPTEELESILVKMGVASFDALLATEGFEGALKKIKEQADKSGRKMTDLFSSIEAMQAVLPLTGTAAGDFATKLEEMKDGTEDLSTAVAVMTESFKQDMRKLRQNVNNILRAIGRGLITIIQPGVQKANELLASLGDIGWDAIALSVGENWDQIARSLIEIMSKALEIIGVKLALWARITKGKLQTAFDPTISKETAEKYFAAWERVATDKIDALFKEMKESGIETFNLVVASAERAAIDTAAALEAIEDAAADMGAAFEITREEWEKLVEKMLVDSKPVNDALEGTIDATNLLKRTFEDVFDTSTMGGDVFKKFIVGIISAIEGVIISAAALNAALTFAWIPITGAVGVASALVALEAAKAGVRSIKFQTGGVVPLQVSGISLGTDTVPALLSPGEIISTQKAANLFGPEITRMNQIAEGLGGSQGGGGDTFIIQALDSASFEQALKRHGLALGRGIRQATRDRNLTMTDLPNG